MRNIRFPFVSVILVSVCLTVIVLQGHQDLLPIGLLLLGMVLAVEAYEGTRASN